LLAFEYTERIKKWFYFVLLCLIATKTSCSSTAQKRVIKNFVDSLDDIELDDPQWQTILGKVATKTNSKSTCLFFRNQKCLLPLRKEIERQKRISNIKIRPFFLNLAKNFTRKTFPKMSEVIANIFSNDTILGNNTSDQIETSSNLLILSTMDKLGQFANTIKRYQPTLVGISATILSVVFLLLVSCLAVVIDKAIQLAKARHQRQLEEYYQLRQRALQG